MDSEIEAFLAAAGVDYTAASPHASRVVRRGQVGAARSTRRRRSRDWSSGCRTSATRSWRCAATGAPTTRRSPTRSRGRSDLKPASETELARHLAMAPGGVAPLPLRGATVLFDRQTLDLDVVYCGAGRPDLTLEIKRADLVRVAGGAIADLTKTL